MNDLRSDDTNPIPQATPETRGNDWSRIAPAGDAWNEGTWLIVVNEKEVKIKRLHEGKIVETYRHMSHTEAAVHMVAISQGFQLPRVLRSLDKPIG